MLILWRGWLLETHFSCVKSFLSCSIWSVCSLFFSISVFNSSSRSCTLILRINKNIMCRSTVVCIYTRSHFSILITSLFFKVLTVNKSGWEVNPVKTSVTVTFFFKSSCAFSAASQVLFSRSCSFFSISASLFNNKKAYLGLTLLGICVWLCYKQNSSFWDEELIGITWNSWTSSVFLDSSAASSSALSSVICICSFMDSTRLDRLS